MSTSAIDITKLPAPRVIEELNYEAYRTRGIQEFVAVWETVRAENPSLGLPSYTVDALETDPFVILNEAESYRETLLRARVNAALRATLLAFAKGSDLDHLAAFYDVSRMIGELDDRLVDRVILAIQGRSTGGTEPRYKFIAMSADIRVQDAIVYTVGRSPLIHVAVFSTAPDGVASADLLEIVNAALQDPAVRMVNDTIVVASAVKQVIDVVVDAWLLPDADVATLDRAADNLRAAWSSARSLGRDFTTSWWMAQLMIAGIHRVKPIAPSADVVVVPSESISIGTITLNNRGRAY
ncbi:Baseplate J family protein [Rhizobium sp. CF080]|uniref:baseplate J/gp47 family protein n=1 Tax=Rhizobium sp. (strain CF080) TaxID=1144310 RepID=UPI0002718930|nr:baseplate J/gp47 family protein [Rhizobium sp. CF080]EUB97306.1 Baseplate J family protein [Rhizobium sp. CF080]